MPWSVSDTHGVPFLLKTKKRLSLIVCLIMKYNNLPQLAHVIADEREVWITTSSKEDTSPTQYGAIHSAQSAKCYRNAHYICTNFGRCNNSRCDQYSNSLERSEVCWINYSPQLRRKLTWDATMSDAGRTHKYDRFTARNATMTITQPNIIDLGMFLPNNYRLDRLVTTKDGQIPGLLTSSATITISIQPSYAQRADIVPTPKAETNDCFKRLRKKERYRTYNIVKELHTVNEIPVPKGLVKFSLAMLVVLPEWLNDG